MVAPPLFSLGQVVMTVPVMCKLEDLRQSAYTYLGRHVRGDWGECDEFDKRQNDVALQTGERLFSAYALPDDTKIWVITEADRASTCVLLPEDY